MKSGYKFLWTNHALRELTDTYKYLEIHFTKRNLKNLSTEIDRTLRLISQNPSLFPLSEPHKFQKVVIKKIQYNVLSNMIT